MCLRCPPAFIPRGSDGEREPFLQKFDFEPANAETFRGLVYAMRLRQGSKGYTGGCAYTESRLTPTDI